MAVLSVESLPVGFRFQPTDAELVNHYLKGKIRGRLSSDIELVPEINVCKCEPWDIPDKSLIKSSDPEWFFFSPKDRKYSNGNRFKRATEAGYWKPTGKDRVIKSRSSRSAPIGMKKTLVFYRGRAPNGIRTNWVMHEYRVVEPEFESGEQGGFVLIRLFNKSEEKKTFYADDCSETLIDKVESEALPPTPTGPLAGEIQHGVGAILVDENVAPMNQEFQYSHLEEVSQSSSNNIMSLGTEMLPEQYRDNQRNLPVEAQNNCLGIMAPEDVNCEANVAGSEVDSLLADIADSLHPEGKVLGHDNYDIVRSPLQPYADYDLPDGLDQGFQSFLFQECDQVAEFLDSVLTDPEEYTPKVSNVEADIHEAMFTGSGTSDTLSGRKINMCHNVEDANWQEMIGFSAKVDEPRIFASCFSDMKVNVPHMTGSRAHLSTSVPLMDSSSGVLHYKPTFVSESRGMRCINDVFSNMEKQATQTDLDSGIKLRTRQFSSNQDSLMEPRSLAKRRLRLQTVIRNRTVSRMDYAVKDSSMDNSVITEADSAGKQNKDLILGERRGSAFSDDMEVTSCHGNINPCELRSAASLVPCNLKSSIMLRKKLTYKDGGRRDFLGKAAHIAGSNPTFGVILLSAFFLFAMSSWCTFLLCHEKKAVSHEFVCLHCS